MRLTRLAIFASVFTEAKKQQPTYVDCVSNGLTVDMKNVHETTCDNKERCQVICQDGYTRLGAKYFKCKNTAKSKLAKKILVSINFFECHSNNFRWYVSTSGRKTPSL